MATFQKFNIFVQDLGRKIHNLNSDTLKVMLTNTAPVATNALAADIVDLPTGSGYSAGGSAMSGNAFTQTSGTAKLTGFAVTFTATGGGSIGPFRYLVLYNSTLAGGPLIGWWDYGSATSILSGSNFTIGADNLGSDWTTSTPILSIT